jgi:hypothetical protein
MKISEIYQHELMNFDCCYLHKDGIFWRAYEKSAMLFHQDIKSYEIKTKHFKGINATLVFIGFPDTGMEKIKSICFEKGFEIRIQDKQIKIFGFTGVDGFDEWKISFINNQPMTTEHNRDNKIKAQRIGLDEKELIESIRSFPIASKTPMECQQFLYQLQNCINGTL